MRSIVLALLAAASAEAPPALPLWGGRSLPLVVRVEVSSLEDERRRFPPLAWHAEGGTLVGTAVSNLSHQGKRWKSYIIAEEILISTLVCAFRVSESSPTKFKSPIELFKLMANRIAFNPTLTTVRIWPGRRGGRDNLLGIRILQSWSTPSVFSILVTIDPPLLSILIDSCGPRTQEKVLDFFSGHLVFPARREIPARYSYWRHPCLEETLRIPIDNCAVPEGHIKHGNPQIEHEIIALLALYRPGPLGSGMVDQFIKGKHGKGTVTHELPQLKKILEDTHGVILYQEQVMQIASALANFSLSDADILRRAMGKKKAEEMHKQQEKFLEGAKRNKISQQKAQTIFERMAKFAEYGFNKSHSAAYAVIAYQTAYLKAHYPVEFMAALLSCDMGNTDKVVRYIVECRDKNIEVLPPDINASTSDFSVDGNRIRFGLAAVKNVGISAIDSITAVRSESGPFASLIDFCKRVVGMVLVTMGRGLLLLGTQQGDFGQYESPVNQIIAQQSHTIVMAGMVQIVVEESPCQSL